MRVLVMGNFSGTRHEGSLADRKFYRVDIDDFEDLFEKLSPVAQIPVGDKSAATIEVKVGELEDFHPDSLYRNVPLFAQLRDLRKRLRETSTFAAAVAELTESLALRSDPAEAGGPAAPPEGRPGDVDQANESDADMLDRVLGQSAARVETSETRPGQINIDNLIHEIVAPYIEPKPDPRQDEFVGHVDAAIAGQMKAILHHPAFQELESAWQALYFLVREVATSVEIQVFVWDVTKAELLSAGESETDRVEDSVLFRRLVTDREQIPFSMFVSNESFGHDINDLILISRLGAIAANAGGPVLASASPELVECRRWTDEIETRSAEEPSPEEENWNSIRTSPVARWIGLCGPRFLLRLPYGAQTDSVDSFDFEEIGNPNEEHDSLLWGAPSIFVATLIGSSFLDSGWSMNPGDRNEIGDLPALTYKEDGEVHLKSCAEVFLTERVAERVLDAGLIPLLGFKNRNAVRALRVQSISHPASALLGPWST